MDKKEYLEPVLEIIETEDIIMQSEPLIDAEGFL